ncbi:MAG: lipopolysaccharide transport periplasmic protein LptA [Proteobacteria bacterium]|nr:lipopolysaccharide transport periplasmic protein LptA [Pseudomonadota bacterium]
MFKRLYLIQMFAATLASSAGLVLAVESSSNESQNMNVRADDFEFDLQARQATYTGKVVFTQGDFKLNADKVQVYLNEANEFIKLEAFGTPARLKDGLSADAIELAGRTLIYEPPAGLVTATGSPRLNRDLDRLQAARIEYNTQTQKAVALGNANRQVQMQLLPSSSPANLTSD